MSDVTLKSDIPYGKWRVCFVPKWTLAGAVEFYGSAVFEVDQGRIAEAAIENYMWSHVNFMDDIPVDRDLRLAVRDGEGMHELVFPCRRLGKTWIDAKTRRPLEVRPTHWQEWSQEQK